VVNGRTKKKIHFNMSFLGWKDDCESAKSNKASKNALWVSTITVFMRLKDKDSPIGTFAVAIGPKGKSHDIVESLISADIMNISYNAVPTIMGWDGVNKCHPCTFSAQFYMSLGDQPEQRGGNVLQLGKSLHHARLHHAIA
jgi:hypothetical protein